MISTVLLYLQYYNYLSNTFSTGTFLFGSFFFFFSSEALPILSKYLEVFAPLLSKLPSLRDTNNLEIPYSHPEIEHTK